jgi:hypothetical protein
VCLWLVGSSVGRRSWELRAGNFRASDPGSAELGPVPLSLLLLPGASGCPQAPLDVAGREKPERGGLSQSQKRSGSGALAVGMQGKGSRLAARAGRPGLGVQSCQQVPRVCVCQAGPGSGPALGCEVVERGHPAVATRHVRNPHRGFCNCCVYDIYRTISKKELQPI